MITTVGAKTGKYEVNLVPDIEAADDQKILDANLVFFICITIVSFSFMSSGDTWVGIRAHKIL